MRVDRVEKPGVAVDRCSTPGEWGSRRSIRRHRLEPRKDGVSARPSEARGAGNCCTRPGYKFGGGGFEGNVVAGAHDVREVKGGGRS